MIHQFPALIIAIPLIAALSTPLVGWKNSNRCYYWAVLTLALVTFFAIGLLRSVILHGPISYHQGGWAPPWGIEYYVDYLNAFILPIIAIVSLFVIIYSKHSINRELAGRQIPSYTLMLLMITGLMGIVVTGDLFNVFVFLEIASLSCYGLIASGGGDAPLATFRYVIMGTIGASCYLLGVGYLYIVTGSLNLADVSRLIPPLYHSRVVLSAGVLMLVGISLKMALFPLHSWLPNAYAYAPSSASALIAPLFTKVAAYLMIRVMFSLFQPDFFVKVIPATTVITWLAVTAMMIGSFYAIAQNNLKKMLSYSVVAQIGYIALGIGLANKAGLTGALLHILNEAFTKGCVFLAVGAIIYQTGDCTIDHFKNLFRRMPFTMGAFTIGVFSMVGVPPTCGFFSKLNLLMGCIVDHHWVFVAVLLISTILNVIYFFRVIKVASFEEPEADYNRKIPYDQIRMQEVPLSMRVPIILMAAGILLAGIFSGTITNTILIHIIPAGF